MPIGRVVFYVEGRGFGFIQPDDGGNDVFVHAKHLANASFLKKDQHVSYEVVTDDRGKLRADKVRVIDGVARTITGNDAIAYDNEFQQSS